MSTLSTVSSGRVHEFMVVHASTVISGCLVQQPFFLIQAIIAPPANRRIQSKHAIFK